MLIPLVLVACTKTNNLSGKPDFDTLNAQAASGYPKAAYELGVQYYSGKYVPKHDAKAYAWLSIAKSEGYPDAEALLAKVEKSMSPAQVAQGQDLATTALDELNQRVASGGYQDKQNAAATGILNAIQQYYMENNRLPPAIANYTVPKDDGHGDTDCKTLGKSCLIEICATTGQECAGMIDLQLQKDQYPLLKDPLADSPGTGFMMATDTAANGKTKVILQGRFSGLIASRDF